MVKCKWSKGEQRTYLSLGADLVRGVWRRLVARGVRECLARLLQPIERVLACVYHFLDVTVRQVRVFRVARSSNTQVQVILEMVYTGCHFLS